MSLKTVLRSLDSGTGEAPAKGSSPHAILVPHSAGACYPRTGTSAFLRFNKSRAKPMATGRWRVLKSLTSRQSGRSVPQSVCPFLKFFAAPTPPKSTYTAAAASGNCVALQGHLAHKKPTTPQPQDHYAFIRCIFFSVVWLFPGFNKKKLDRPASSIVLNCLVAFAGD
jgi:hypothetical protein